MDAGDPVEKQDNVTALELPDKLGDDQATERIPSKRAARDYSPVEKAGLLWLCIRDGVTATSKAHGVSRSTLTTWLSEAGGIEQVRAWLQEQTLADFLQFERSLYAEATRRVAEMPNDEMGMILRKLIEARALVPAQSAAAGQDSGVAAGAVAHAAVTVTVKDGDGEIVETYKVHE